MDLKKQIQKIIKGDAANDTRTIADNSKDASVFKLVPQVVVFPKDSEDIKNLVKFVVEETANGNKLSIAPRAAGTDMTGGPLSESIVLSQTKYLNQIIKFGKESAVAQPGVFYRDFEKESLKRGLLLPSYPASREMCALGGMVANNSGGELNLNYGKTENFVTSLKMVLSDGKEYSFKALNMTELEKKKQLKGLEGEIYRDIFALIDKNYDLLKKAKPQVSKNSAGYYLWNVYDKEKGIFDLTKLIVGSQGTLGIITETTFKLVKPKVREHLLVVFLNDIQQLPAITNHLLKFNPQSIESYDDQTLKVAIKLIPDLLARLKGNAIKLFFGFIPELWMALTGGIPKLVLLAEFSSDTEKDALERTIHAKESLVEFGVKTKLVLSDSDSQKYWVIRRESFNMLRHHVAGLRTAPFIDDFVVKPEVLGEFLPKLYEILNKYKLLYTVAGHVGDGNFHIIPLMKVGDPQAGQIIKMLGEEVYKLVLDYKGSITGEHNDGMIRGPYLEQMYGHKVYGLFEKTKNIFDPNNIFNPGKKIGVNQDYAMSHLDFN